MKGISTALLIHLSIYALAQNWSGDGTNLYFTTGKVGVGTANPTASLDVRGNLVIKENPNSFVNGDVTIFNHNGPNYGFMIRPYDASFNGGRFNWERDFGYMEGQKYWYAEGGFRVANGKLGVGTYSPYQYSMLEVVSGHSTNYYDAQLHLHTSAYAYGMFAGSHSPKYGVVSQGGHYYRSGDFKARADQVTGMIQDNGAIKFFSNSALTAGATFSPIFRFVINNNGNIGVGKTDPTARLDVKGATNSYTTEHFIVRDQYNNKDFVIRGDGSVEIGYDVDVPNGYKLGVAGTAIMEEVVVKLKANWPDYVFSPEHQLPSLAELESYLQVNHRLPGIPSAAEVEENGIALGEMNAKLMEKIEELTLYMIQQNRKIEKLELENHAIKAQLKMEAK